MDVQEIQVVIDENGKVSVSLQGVKGNGCLSITKELEHLLGDEVVDRKMSHESYDPPTPLTNKLSNKTKK
jgi:hypothetical protein